MNLRKLEYRDAPFMLEWMQDKSVVQDLKTDFSSKTIQDCVRFIESNQDNHNDVNFAVVDDNDIYMGTVSLKNIRQDYGTAEFAITVRASAMGHGFSKFGMTEIIRYGFEKLHLKAIFWCVSKENRRAIRFYDKNQYNRTEIIPEYILNDYATVDNMDLLWYKAAV